MPMATTSTRSPTTAPPISRPTSCPTASVSSSLPTWPILRTAATSTFTSSTKTAPVWRGLRTIPTLTPSRCSAPTASGWYGPRTATANSRTRPTSSSRTGWNSAVNVKLNEVEARVLGALIEKEISTPDYYPLSLNALVNACNQKNNREPVMTLDESSVRTALYNLQAKGLAGPASGADSRVTKYEHRIQEVFNFTRAETAIIDVLLLRGPQTPGELRGRSERMYRFEELSDVQATLQRLIERDPPLVKILPRQPGTKESRYAHLLAGDVEGGRAPAESSAPVARGGIDDERLARLESEIAELKKEIAELKTQVEVLKQR